MQEHLVAANSRAVQLIALAEQMFGPMGSPWKYAGVMFRDHPPTPALRSRDNFGANCVESACG